MMKWYDLNLMYLTANIVFFIVDKKLMIFPRKGTTRSIVLWIIALAGFITWNFGLSRYMGYEYSAAQYWHQFIAIIIHGFFHFSIFKPYLMDEPRHRTAETDS